MQLLQAVVMLFMLHDHSVLTLYLHGLYMPVLSQLPTNCVRAWHEMIPTKFTGTCITACIPCPAMVIKLLPPVAELYLLSFHAVFLAWCCHPVCPQLHVDWPAATIVVKRKSLQGPQLPRHCHCHRCFAVMQQLTAWPGSCLAYVCIFQGTCVSLRAGCPT